MPEFAQAPHPAPRDSLRRRRLTRALAVGSALALCAAGAALLMRPGPGQDSVPPPEPSARGRARAETAPRRTALPNDRIIDEDFPASGEWEDASTRPEGEANPVSTRAQELAAEGRDAASLMPRLSTAILADDAPEFWAVVSVLAGRLAQSPAELKSLMEDLRRMPPEAPLHGLPAGDWALLAASLPGSETAAFVRERLLRGTDPSRSHLLLQVFGWRGADHSGLPHRRMPDRNGGLTLSLLAGGGPGPDEDGTALLREALQAEAFSGIRMEAIRAAGRFQNAGKGVENDLTEALLDRLPASPEPRERQAILAALSLSPGDEPRRVLLSTLRGAAAREDRAAAAQALRERAGEPEVCAALLEACDEGAGAGLLISVLEVLQPARGHEDDFVRAVSAQAGRAEDPVVRLKAVAALSRAGAAVRPLLESIADNDRDAAVRRAARQLAETLPPPAPVDAGAGR